VTSPFTAGEQLSLSFDEHRRLRVMAPEQMLPLVAWLYTDVQPNLAAVDQMLGTLQRCRAEGLTLIGNGALVDFLNEVVVLESRYDTWERHVVPQSVFWPVLTGVRAYLAGTAGQPLLARPPDYPLALRGSNTHVEEGRTYLVEYTYFPRKWSTEQVHAAGDGAWASPQLVRDEATGLWSGMWQGLELAGYYDKASGEPLTYFPVISP
jgi:hypothetical protein